MGSHSLYNHVAKVTVAVPRSENRRRIMDHSFWDRPSEQPVQRLPNDLIGVAGVHFVVFKLSLRGLIVLPTIRNTAGIDLLVNDPRTGGQGALQVKASMRRVDYWPTSKPEKCLRGARNGYVFLRFDADAETFDAFFVDAETVLVQVMANVQHHRDRGRGEFPYFALPSSEEQAEELRRAWRSWRPGAA
jgi:hypothetical protein